jgi:hypothetical protein
MHYVFMQTMQTVHYALVQNYISWVLTTMHYIIVSMHYASEIAGYETRASAMHRTQALNSQMANHTV